MDVRDAYFDDPEFYNSATGGRGPWTTTGSRDHGRDYPLVFNEQELTITRQICRYVSDTDATGQNIQENLSNYIIGKGYTLRFIKRKGQQSDPQAIVWAQRFLDEFDERNQLSAKMFREIFRREVRDGESASVLFPAEGGQVDLRVIEPEQIKEPSNPRQIEEAYGFDSFASDWTFGVHTDAGDIQKPLGFYVQWNPTGSDWDYLPESRCEFGKRNTDSNVKRGISDFYPVIPQLQRADKLLANTSAGAIVQAAIAYVREHPMGTTGRQISDFAASKTDRTYNQPTGNGNSRQRNIAHIHPGTVLDVINGLTYKQGPLASGEAVSAFLEIIAAGTRKTGARFCMPEYMISGDASNANYSSTMVSESPFVKKCEHEQGNLTHRFKSIVKKAMAIAWEGGYFYRLAGMFETFADFWYSIELQVTPPAVATRDTLKDAQASQILNASRIKSPQTWCDELGLDFEQEMQNFAHADSQFGPAPEPLPLPKEKIPTQAGATESIVFEGGPGSGPHAGSGGGDKHDQKIAKIKAEMAALKASHETAMNGIKDAHEAAVNTLQSHIDTIHSDLDKQLKKIKADSAARTAARDARIAARTAARDKEKAAFNAKYPGAADAAFKAGA